MVAACAHDRFLAYLRVTSGPWLDRETQKSLLRELLEELCASTGIASAWFLVRDKESEKFLLAGAHPAADLSDPRAEAIRTYLSRLERDGDIAGSESLRPTDLAEGPQAKPENAVALRLRVSDEVIGLLVLVSFDEARLDELISELTPFWTGIAVASSNALVAQEAQRQQSDVLRANRRLTFVLGALEKRQSLVETLNAKLADANRFLEQRTAELGRSRAQLEESLRRLEETQEQLVHAGKMAAIGTLAAGVAHEINNPLTYVIANLSFIERGVGCVTSSLPPGDAAEMNEVIKEAKEGAERVRIIVRDLRTAARMGEEKRGPVDVSQVMETSLKMAANEIRHRARLIREFEPVPPVAANEARLGQVFLNLLVNAAQAIQRGSVDENEIRVVVRPAEGRVSVEVHDTGCGIDAKSFGRLFSPFFTTKPVGAGTGLGLWVCHNIVEGMGGEIRARSTPGAGSVFTVLLPAFAVEERVEAAPPPAPLARGNGARVLVVDDEASAGRSLQRLLGAFDYDVVVNTSPRQALLRLEEGERFAAILCDIMMPELNGIQFARAVARLEDAHLNRLIFITGGVFDPAIERELATLDYPRIDKPFDERQLLAAVARATQAAV